jgi:hypothetical protein
MAVLPDESVTIASTQTLLDVPHYGSVRITAFTAALAAKTIDVPLSPSFVSARVDGTRAVVEWNDAVRGPVSGFRIEARVGNEEWTQVEAWYDAATRSASVELPEGALVRVRAFNDWGAAAPSVEARVTRGLGRRRSVR